MKYIILDWMDGSRERFESEEKAKAEFDRRKKYALENNEEFDMMVFKWIDEFNNVS